MPWLHFTIPRKTIKPLKSSLNLPLWLWGRFEVGRHARRFITYCAYKNCRFDECVSGWSSYKNSHISVTIVAIRFKFATKVPKALYFHNLVLTRKKISPTYFRIDGHIYVPIVMYGLRLFIVVLQELHCLPIVYMFV